jgi:hypothetical protein
MREPSAVSASGLRRATVTLAAAVVFVAVVVVLLVQVVFPQRAPAKVPLPAPVGAALTKHVVLIVIDGLRYDVAIDPVRMPELSRRMREHTSGEMLAGAVSMTSSAVLTMGTGQRGDFEQIVKNESHSPSVYDDVITNAHAAGLTTAFAGDSVWTTLYPEAWTVTDVNPHGFAIDVDEDAPLFASARALLGRDPAPAVTVVHFATPDHTGHAVGIFSAKYQAYIQGFDRELGRLLDAIGPDTTVFVTSDHGATAAGTHGSDTPDQRRCPIVAYGPGIVAGRHDAQPLDQADLPATFAALLGVPGPAEGRGHVLAEWLDVSDPQRAAIACATLGQLVQYAHTIPGYDATGDGAAEACAAPAPRDRIARAAAAAARVDARIGTARVSGSLGWIVSAFALVSAVLLAWFVVRGSILLGTFARATLAALVVVVVAVVLTFFLERLPGHWPDRARGILYAIGNVALIAGIVRAPRSEAFLERRIAMGAVIFPGILAVTETMTTQPESFVVANALLALAWIRGIPAIEGERRRFPRARFVVGAAWLAVVAPAALFESGYVADALTSRPPLLLAAAIAAIVAFALLRHYREGRARGASPPLWRVLALAAVASACLVLRRYAPAPLCVIAWIGLAIAAVLVLRRGSRTLGELLALASYAWVSRDAEIPLLLATVYIATELGDAVGESLARRPGDTPKSAIVAIVAFLFAWTYLQRIGVQLGVDFVHLDWGAGAFRQADVSIERIAGALIFKHALARAAILFAVLAPLAGHVRDWALRGLFIVEVGRAATLVTMLYACRTSYWTPFRMVGDVPHTLLAVLVAAVGLVIVNAARRHPALKGSKDEPEAAA